MLSEFWSISVDRVLPILYTSAMKKKSLIETNPYLKDPVKCEAALIRFVVSSSAIEGVRCKGMEGSTAATGKFVVKNPSSVRRPSKQKKANP